MNHPQVTIYTDGSWRGRIKCGGYAAFLTDDFGRCMLVSAGMPDTTISRMELSAVAVALSYVHDNTNVTVVSDSQYAVNIINKWLHLWEKTDYTKVNGGEVANRDILDVLAYHIHRMHKVKAVWTKGHTGYTDIQSLGNDICDYAAVQAAEAAYRA